MVRGSIHGTEYDQRLLTDILREMFRDCRHGTTDGEGMHTRFMRWSGIADIVQETNYKHGTRAQNSKCNAPYDLIVTPHQETNTI